MAALIRPAAINRVLRTHPLHSARRAVINRSLPTHTFSPSQAATMSNVSSATVQAASAGQPKRTAETPLSPSTQPTTKAIKQRAAPKYKFSRSDFGPLPLRPLHLDLQFDILEQRVRVTATTTFLLAPDQPAASTLRLNAKDLQIQSFEHVETSDNLKTDGTPSDFVKHVKSFGKSTPLKFEYKQDPDNVVLITLSEPLQPGKQITLRSVSDCHPNNKVLEGIYVDYTPKGRPTTMISQCQQYGFQRIVPSVDMMPAKAYYTTTITADKRYAQVISNGDPAPEFFDEQTGEMQPKPEDASKAPSDKPADVERVVYKYYNHTINMASYLFFIGAGSWVKYKRTVEYPTPEGHDDFQAELLAYEGLVDPQYADLAVDSLVQHILWNYVSTGPEATEHLQEQQHIYELIKQRDQLRDKQGDQQKLASVRQQLSKLISQWGKTGYKYTGAIYREIAMENSDYGGMENVGNTTIISSRLTPSPYVTDAGYIYVEGVKIHEWYHNINGSEVTGMTPFEIWLNEAVTVHIQRQREYVLFGEDYLRLRDAIQAQTPGAGPLSIDRSANAMAVEPAGFNRTQELISGMTYFKAPEYIRMVQTIISKPVFNKGLDAYHTKYKYSNATTSQWIECMVQASGNQDLYEFSDRWLKRTSYPDISYTTSYDASKHTYNVNLHQTGFEHIDDGNTPWYVPIEWALVKDGKVLKSGMHLSKQAHDEIVVSDVPQAPDYFSFASGWSYYGTSKWSNATQQNFRLQALTDPDAVNRYFAFRGIADAQKAQLIEAKTTGQPAPTVSDDYVDLHATILFDNSLTPASRALLVREGDSDISTRPDLAHYYREISDAKTAMLAAVYAAHGDRIQQLYKELESQNKPGPHLEQFQSRALKHHLYGLIIAGAKAQAGPKINTLELAENLYKSSFMSDRIVGLSGYLSDPSATWQQKQQFVEKAKAEFSQHPDALQMYVSAIASADTDDAAKLIRELMADTSVFNISLAGHARAVAGGWAHQRKRSLLTADGLALSRDAAIAIGQVNQMSAQSFVHSFNDLPKFDSETQQKLKAALREMRDGFDAVKQQSLYNQITTLLES